MATQTKGDKAMLAMFNPYCADYIVRDAVESFCAENPDLADRLRALAPGCAIAVPIGGGPFNVIVHETDDYFVKWQPRDGEPLGAEGEYIGIHSGRPEPIEWEAL